MATLQPVGSFPQQKPEALAELCSAQTPAIRVVPQKQQPAVLEYVLIGKGQNKRLIAKQGHVPICGILHILDSYPSRLCWPHPQGLLYIFSPQDRGDQLPLRPRTTSWICSHSSHSTGLGKTMTPSWGWDRRTRDGTATARGLSLG